MSGPLQYVAWLFDQESIEVALSGHIVPGIVGSRLCAQLPGSIQFSGGMTAMDPQLIIEIDDASSNVGFPTCFVEAGLVVAWPGQEPLFFSSSLGLFLGGARLCASLEGMVKNIFGLYGLHAGNWSLGGSIDSASLVQGGLVPLSDFSMQFELGMGTKSVKMASCFSPSALAHGGDIAFEGALEGGFSLSECVDFVGSIIEESPSIAEGKKEFKERVDGFMLDFELGDVFILFSQQEIEIEGRKLTKGLVIDGQAKLFGSDVQVFLDIQNKGLKILGYLENLEFGPLKITGPGYDKIMHTPDDGLTLNAELSLENQYCFIAGRVEVDIFGGISDQIKIDISSSGVSFETNKKLFDLFDCGLAFTAELTNHWTPVDFYVKGYMHQSALTAIQQILSKTAHRMAKTKMRLHRRSKAGLYGTISNIYNGFWNLLANLVGNTFNITEFTFESSLDQLVGETRLPRVTIKGIVLGKKFELYDLVFDLNNPVGSAQEIIQQVALLFD